MRMNLERWVDELAGEIDNIKKMITGGSGTKVEYTPQEWVSATKLGTLKIGGVDTDVEMPTIGMTQVVQAGTKVATHDYNGSHLDIYVPVTAAPFIDIANAGSTQSGTGQLNYTATEDCVVYAYAASADANATLAFKLDNVNVFVSNVAAARKYVGTMIYMKAGQVLTSSGATEGAAAEDKGTAYRVFPLLGATQPTPPSRNSKKGAKK